MYAMHVCVCAFAFAFAIVCCVCVCVCDGVCVCVVCYKLMSKSTHGERKDCVQFVMQQRDGIETCAGAVRRCGA